MSQSIRIVAPAIQDAEPILNLLRDNGIHAVAAADTPAPEVAAERDRLLDELRSDRETLKTMLNERHRAEAALIQSEKLAAVGRLAASISHEINNPLESITNLLYLIRQEDDLPERALTYLTLAERELARVSEIAGQTLRFQRQSSSPTRVTPEELLESVVALYQGRLINANITLAFDHQGAAPVTCYEGDIRQVLNNLVGNAIEAMRSGGRLVIRTRNANCWRTGRPGVRITIADTGSGMPPEVVTHIFEAFYTTKGLSGTGLGLWISHGIVEKHTGVLSVRSSIRSSQSGTVFSLFLPRELQLAA
jgi:signal transduction histidine kinase